jgi:hypothetical protein
MFHVERRRSSVDADRAVRDLPRTARGCRPEMTALERERRLRLDPRACISPSPRRERITPAPEITVSARPRDARVTAQPWAHAGSSYPGPDLRRRHSCSGCGHRSLAAAAPPDCQRSTWNAAWRACPAGALRRFLGPTRHRGRTSTAARPLEATTELDLPGTQLWSPDRPPPASDPASCPTVLGGAGSGTLVERDAIRGPVGKPTPATRSRRTCARRRRRIPTIRPDSWRCEATTAPPLRTPAGPGERVTARAAQWGRSSWGSHVGRVAARRRERGETTTPVGPTGR